MLVDTSQDTIDYIALGNYHSAILKGSQLFMSGVNGSGQLGIGSQINQHSFVLVPGISPISVALGDEHTVIIDELGQLMVAGSNAKGQIGATSNLDHPYFITPPYRVESPIILVRCGAATTLVLTMNGEVLMSGINILVQGLGDCLTFTLANAMLKINEIVNMWIVNNDGKESVIILDESDRLWYCQANSNPELLYRGSDARSIANIFRGDNQLPLIKQSYILILDKSGDLYSLDNMGEPIFAGVNKLVPSRDGNSACILYDGHLAIIMVGEDGELRIEHLTHGVESLACNGDDVIIHTTSNKLLAIGYNSMGQLGAPPFKGEIETIQIELDE